MNKENELTKTLVSKYWLAKLSDYNQVAASNTTGLKETEYSSAVALDDAIISTLAKKDLFAEYALYLSVYVALLKVHYQLSEIIVASPAIKLSGVANTGGVCFYKFQLEENYTLKDIIKIVQKEIEETVKYQDYVFSDLVDSLSDKNISAAGLFRFAFSFSPLNDELTAEYTGESFRIMKDENVLTFKLSSPSGFEDAVVSEKFVERFIVFSKQFESALNKPVQSVPVFLAGEKEIISSFNDHAKSNPSAKTIPGLFEEWAEKMPDKTALVSESGTYSYSLLNEKANQLAHYLREKHMVDKEVPVAIMLPRTEHAIITIMAILKTGGVYVPIDPNYPEERTSYILKTTNTKVLITFSSLSSKVKNFDGKVMFADFQLDMLSTPTDNLLEKPAAKDLAYVIHTSGSTGQPKGVMVEHRSVVRLVQNTNYINITPEDNVLALSNFAFDGSVFDIFGALTNGAALILATKEMSLDMISFSEEIREKNVTMFFVTTALFNSLVDNVLDDLSFIKKIMFGGEVVSVKHVNKFIEKYGPGKLIHVYGPTENTTFSTFFPVEKAGWIKTIPVGKAITASKCFVVNAEHDLLPVGIAGELCVAGEGLARGYMADAELTSKKIIVLPGTAEKVYKTGDLVRWLPSGDIEFIGRIDNQVKIRGYRIELEEIEKNMLGFEGIKGAAALVTENKAGDKYITAYVEASAQTDTAGLHEYLKKFLPDIMLPQKYFVLDKFPLNANGKINKKILSQLVISEIQELKASYVAPSTKTEELLVNLWQEILVAERIGVNDNFFEQGGHSLKAAQFIARLYNETGVKIELKSIFTAPLISALALLVDEYKDNVAEVNSHKINAVLPAEYYELSHAQKRFFIVDQQSGGGSAYNVTSTYLLEGDLDADVLKQALNTLCARHESLRSTFTFVKGQPVQKIHAVLDADWSYLDMRNAQDQETFILNYSSELFCKSFDLEKGSLLRVSVLKLTDDRHLLLFAAHHIICDGWSITVLEKELMHFYKHYKFNEALTLSALNIQYKDFAAWQNDVLNNTDIKSHKAFWHEKLAGDTPAHYMPYDKDKEAKNNEAGTQTFIIIGDDLGILKRSNKDAGVTMFISLTAAIKMLIYKLSAHKDISIGTDIMLRDYPELQDQVGLYLNNLVLRTSLDDTGSYMDFLQKIKSTVVEAFDHKIYPYDKLMEEMGRLHDGKVIPFFDVFLVYRNYNSTSEQTSGALKSVAADKYSTQASQSKFNITFGFTENADALICNVEYNKELFSGEMIEKYITDLQTIIMQGAVNKHLSLKQIKESIQDKQESKMTKEMKENAVNDISEDF